MLLCCFNDNRLTFLVRIVNFDQMKALSLILFVAFFAITITPLAYMCAPEQPQICELADDCCITESEMKCTDSDSDCCPPGMCNPSLCVFCCFLCPVQNEKFAIRVFETDQCLKKQAGRISVSDFSSECFQPPEAA
jgi:hypothetical protein